MVYSLKKYFPNIQSSLIFHKIMRVKDNIAKVEGNFVSDVNLVDNRLVRWWRLPTPTVPCFQILL